MVKSMHIKLVFIMFFILGILNAYAAVNYQELSIEQRSNQLKQTGELTNSRRNTQADDEAIEQEKNLIAQQLTVITGDEDTRYNIVEGDTIKVIFKDQAKMITGVYQVNGQGEISLPLVGNAKVSGLNRGSARSYLNQLFGEYIRDPQLTLEINTSGKYTVVGAAGPGVYALEGDVMLMDAVLRSGYDTNRSSLGTVLVMRGGRDHPQILRLNLNKMMVRGDRSDNIAIKPNDLIYIPNTLFYDIDKFKDKMFSYIADYYTLGGTTILKQQAKPSTSGSSTTE